VSLGFRPGSPVEAAIALRIVLLASEIVRLRRGQPSLTAWWPWVVAFSFGPLHGFGFAGALAEIALAARRHSARFVFVQHRG
jgi:HupE / UreJ protein